MPGPVRRGPRVSEPWGGGPAAGGDADLASLAARVVDALRGAGQTVATAESLTGGLVVATLIDVPGASAVVRGGIVAYQADLKTALVGVAAAVLDAGGAVQPEVAAQLASGAAQRCRATWGVGTTGVAGPDPADGQPVGTVFTAVAGPAGTTTRRLELSGSRDDIRRGTVRACLELLLGQLP